MAREALPADEQNSTGTPTLLLDVAERLFAMNGLDKVSIREIIRASGQSNLSAAHYHFGSREALVAAVIDRRMRFINVLRDRRLDELEASGGDGSVYRVVMTMVGVLAEVVKTMPWGPDYVRLLAQALFSPQLHIREMIDPQALGSYRRFKGMLRHLLPDLPARVFNDRFAVLESETAYSIARWIQSNGPVSASRTRSYNTMTRNTVDFLAAGMAAPIGGP
jgi:AcrR family transcriptional regulator